LALGPGVLMGWAGIYACRGGAGYGEVGGVGVGVGGGGRKGNKCHHE